MQDHPNESPYTVSELLSDRLRHGIVFCEATLRTLNEALALLDREEGDDGDS